MIRNYIKTSLLATQTPVKLRLSMSPQLKVETAAVLDLISNETFDWPEAERLLVSSDSIGRGLRVAVRKNGTSVWFLFTISIFS